MFHHPRKKPINPVYPSWCGRRHGHPFRVKGSKKVGNIRGKKKTRDGYRNVCFLRTSPGLLCFAGRQTSSQEPCLGNLACGKFAVWFHFTLVGGSGPGQRLHCELHSPPPGSPFPFQRGSGSSRSWAQCVFCLSREATVIKWGCVFTVRAV